MTSRTQTLVNVALQWEGVRVRGPCNWDGTLFQLSDEVLMILKGPTRRVLIYVLGPPAGTVTETGTKAVSLPQMKDIKIIDGSECRKSLTTGDSVDQGRHSPEETLMIWIGSPLRKGGNSKPSSHLHSPHIVWSSNTAVLNVDPRPSRCCHDLRCVCAQVRPRQHVHRL